MFFIRQLAFEEPGSFFELAGAQEYPGSNIAVADLLFIEVLGPPLQCLCLIQLAFISFVFRHELEECRFFPQVFLIPVSQGFL